MRRVCEHVIMCFIVGENTLEAQLTRLLTRHLTHKEEGKEEEEGPSFASSAFLKEYISFMTTPNSHRDTYASTCHRMFFANYVKGKAPEDCADNDGHNVDTIDALTLTVPIIIAYANSPPSLRHRKIEEVIRATRRTSPHLTQYAIAYSDLLLQVIGGKDLQEAVEQCASRFEGDDGLVSLSMKKKVENAAARGWGDPMTACYIDSSFPSLLFLAYKYAKQSPEIGLLANANAGKRRPLFLSLLRVLRMK